MKNPIMNLPKAVTCGIIEQEADRELLIYDLRSNKAYTLNETSKVIYKACGETTFEDLKRTHQFTDDLIYLTLDKLAANNLIEDYESTHFAGMTRRDVIKKVGLGTMTALPLITAIIAPKAIQAASGCVNVGGAATGEAVSVNIINPTGNTSDNQAVAGNLLALRCCSNSYRSFISNGCSAGVGAVCRAQAICN